MRSETIKSKIHTENIGRASVLVSVIIPAYNRKDTIVKSVESVLEQTYKDIELIIVDDGSTDGTYEIIRKMEKKDPRVHCIKHSYNKGACAARNEGIRNSIGEFIAFQDSDDIWEKNKLELQLEVLNKYDCDVCFSQFYLKKNGRTRIVPNDYNAGIQERVDNVYAIGTVTLVFRREVILNHLFDEQMPRLQDFELMLRIVKNYKVFFLDKPLVYAQYSANSISIQNDSLLRACGLLQAKYPQLKKDFPKTNKQLAKVLIKSSYSASGKLRFEMIKKALEFDDNIDIILRIPYYYFTLAKSDGIKFIKHRGSYLLSVPFL